MAGYDAGDVITIYRCQIYPLGNYVRIHSEGSEYDEKTSNQINNISSRHCNNLYILKRLCVRSCRPTKTGCDKANINTYTNGNTKTDSNTEADVNTSADSDTRER